MKAWGERSVKGASSVRRMRFIRAWIPLIGLLGPIGFGCSLTIGEDSELFRGVVAEVSLARSVQGIDLIVTDGDFDLVVGRGSSATDGFTWVAAEGVEGWLYWISGGRPRLLRSTDGRSVIFGIDSEGGPQIAISGLPPQPYEPPSVGTATATTTGQAALRAVTEAVCALEAAGGSASDARCREFQAIYARALSPASWLQLSGPAALCRDPVLSQCLTDTRDFLAEVQSRGCVHLDGDWDGIETATFRCSDGQTQTVSGEGLVDFRQTNCTLTWTVGGIAGRSGTVVGRRVSASGPALLLVQQVGDGMNLNLQAEGDIQISGEVMGNNARFTARGTLTGQAASPGQSSAVDCELESVAELMRVAGEDDLPVVRVETIDFQGEDLQIDGRWTTPVGVEWRRGQQPPTRRRFTPDTSSPAAFVAGQPLTASVEISVSSPSVAEVGLRATGFGDYGDVSIIWVPVSNGRGQFDLVTTRAPPRSVRVSTIRFFWDLVGVNRGRGRDVFRTPRSIGMSEHRIYTLVDTPFPPMGLMNRMGMPLYPWASVLELAAGMANGAGTNPETIAQRLTEGFFNSGWRQLSDPVYINPRATFEYVPRFSRSTRRVTVRGLQIRYNLQEFLDSLEDPQTLQQCDENAIVLVAMLTALGIEAYPLWFGSEPPRNAYNSRLPPISYCPAGGATPVSVNPGFRFHQIARLGRRGPFFDPSLKPPIPGPSTCGGPVLRAQSLDDYLTQAFGSQRPRQVSEAEPNVEFEILAPTTPRFTSIDEPEISRSTPQHTRYIRGGGFNTLPWLGVDPNSGLTIASREILGTDLLSVEIAVTPTAPLGMTEIYGGIGQDPWTRIEVEIVP